MAKKKEPSANNKSETSTNSCPIGSHHVREHSMRMPPSKKHPDGIVVIRHAHCRKNVSSAEVSHDKGEQCTDALHILDADGIKKLIRQVNPNGNPKLIALVDPNMLEEYEINTPNRLAAFIAQISSETDFHASKEAPTKKKAQEYDNNPRIGNRYRGRGLIQLTSKDNYTSIGKAIGVDLANNPELAIDDRYNFLIALEFWKMKKGNKIADTGDIDEVTRKINGKKAKQERLAKSRTRYTTLKQYLDEL